MGASKERAQNSATSSLKGARKRIKRDHLDQSNAPLTLTRQASALPMFMAFETHPEPLVRWVHIDSVFPGTALRTTGDQVRETAVSLIETTEASTLDALPPLAATFHLPSEWGGEIFGTKDATALAAYAAMDFVYVPVEITRSHHFIDATLDLRFPATDAPSLSLKGISVRVAKETGLGPWKPFARSAERQERALASLWRIHDCLRDFLLEGELVKDEATRRYTATIKSTSLFPWLADERLDIIGEAFTTAHPHQARHGKVPSVTGDEGRRRKHTLPPSISSED